LIDFSAMIRDELGGWRRVPDEAFTDWAASSGNGEKSVGPPID
jgi:hypothetical protein